MFFGSRYSMRWTPLEDHYSKRCSCKKTDASACARDIRLPINACTCTCHKPQPRVKKARKK